MDEKKDQSLLITINKAISSISDNFELYNAIFENLKSGYKFDIGGIAIYHNNNSNLHVYFVRGDSLLNDPDAVLLNEDILLSEFSQNKQRDKIRIMTIDEIAGKKNLNGSKAVDILDRFNINELIISPLQLRGKIIGHMGLAYKNSNITANFDLELLQSIATSLAVAISNTIAYQRLAQKEIIDKVLLSLASLMPDINNKEQFFSVLITEINKHIGLEYFCITNPAGKTPLCFMQNHYGKFETSPAGSSFSESIKILDQRLASSENPHLKIEFSEFNNFCKDSPYFSRLSMRHNINSILYTKENISDESEFSWLAGRYVKEQYPDGDAEFITTLMPEIAVIYKNFLFNERIKLSQNKLEQEKRTLLDEINYSGAFGNIIGTSRAIQYTIEKVKQVAPLDVSALIQGETGTGKELIAYAIHERSGRNKNPFIKINCAAMPAQLIESELFGHEKGSFTGADKKRIGKFELAHCGTIFLDEIGELPLELQAKLLRVLQEKEIERVGGNEVIKTDVRVLAATNRNLEKEAERRTFRADLFFRLNVFPINVPPLRERAEDIPLLIKYFMERFSKKNNKPQMSVKDVDLKALMEYHWPGNVRELQNIIERAVIISDGDYLQFSELWFRSSQNAGEDLSYYQSLDEIEKNAIVNVLRATNGKLNGENGAAKILGINAKTLLAKMKKYGIKKEVIIIGE